MKLGLINTYSTRNVGDLAIYNAIASMAGNATLATDLPEGDAHGIPGLDRTLALEQCDAYVSVGGDIFNNAREWLVTRQFLKNLQRIASVPADRAFLFGQSIPRSCHGLAFAALARVLRRLPAVYVRDEESYRRLQAAGVAVHLSYDTVFALDMPVRAEAAARRLFVSQGVEPERCALISLRGFDSMYRHDNAQFEQRIVQLCKGLQQRGHTPALLIQAEADGADQDAGIAERLRAQVPGLAVINAFSSEAAVSSWELAAAATAIAHIVVAVRYHTAIFRLLAGRMPFNLYYSNKGRDLSSRLALPGCDLKDFDPSMHMLSCIEATADRSFNVKPIRDQVRADFIHALAAVSGQPQQETLTCAI